MSIREAQVKYYDLSVLSVDTLKADMSSYKISVEAMKNETKVLQFWSSEQIKHPEIICSIVSSNSGTNKRIFARNCDVVEIDSRTYSKFCNENHLQGSAGARARFALVHDMIIVAVMSFGASRFDKNNEWEMIRFCCLLNFTIVGGASKLWKHFMKTRNPNSVVSYADARISNGNLYKKLGFTFKHHSGPNYWYTKDFENLFSRVKFQKHKLKEALEVFDENLTEKQNMIFNGYRIVYDAGNLVFEWKK